MNFPHKSPPDFWDIPTVVISKSSPTKGLVILLNSCSFEVFVCFAHYTCFARPDVNLNIIGRCAQSPLCACVELVDNNKGRSSFNANVILILRATNMAETKGCMLEFKGDTKLTSEEFVKVFKEFDKDGKNISILNTILKRHCRSLIRVLITSCVKYKQTIPRLFFLLSGNGYIEADELDQFLQTLLQETGNEVRWAVNN